MAHLADVNTRHIAFAIVQTPYRPLTRKDGLDFLQGLSERALPDLSYRYNENRQRDGRTLPSIALVGQEGRSKTEIKVDFFNGALRLFTNFLHPASRGVVNRQVDQVLELFHEQLGAELDPQLVESRVAVDIPTKRGTAGAMLGNRFFGIDSLKLLGEVEFTSVMVRTGSEERAPMTELDNPSRDIKIERLLEDPRRVFIEVVTKWLKAIQVLKQDHTTGQAAISVSPGPLQNGLKKPTDYIEESTNFITDQVIRFIQAKRES